MLDILGSVIVGCLGFASMSGSNSEPAIQNGVQTLHRVHARILREDIGLADAAST
jgi:hypothetical protein